MMMEYSCQTGPGRWSDTTVFYESINNVTVVTNNETGAVVSTYYGTPSGWN